MEAPRTGLNATAIADIVLATEGSPLIRGIEPWLACDADIAAELTDLARRSGSPADFSEEVHRIADALDRRLGIEREEAAGIMLLRGSPRW